MSQTSDRKTQQTPPAAGVAVLQHKLGRQPVDLPCSWGAEYVFRRQSAAAAHIQVGKAKGKRRLSLSHLGRVMGAFI